VLVFCANIEAKKGNYKEVDLVGVFRARILLTSRSDSPRVIGNV
jgi:hypothetical protein